MKRLAVAIAAALILLSVSVTAYALPEDSQEASQTESGAVQNDSDDADGGEQSGAEDNSSSDNSKNDDDKAVIGSGEAEASAIDLDKMQFATYNIKNVDMYIDIPKDMYVITPGIAADDPALKAAGMTKKEAEENLSENDTAIKAFATDFSYNITVTMIKNSNTEQIGSLSRLDDKQVQKIMDSLLREEYTTGCARNTYNNVLFLTLNMEYKEENGTNVYGIQQYTVINDANIIITFQSKNQPLTDDHRALFNKIMSSVFFDVEDEKPVESSVISDVGSTTIQELDRRYLLIIAGSIIAAAALAGIIIVAIKRRETVAHEFDPTYENILRYVKNGDLFTDEELGIVNGDAKWEILDDDSEEKPAPKKEEKDLYSNSRPSDTGAQGVTGKLNSTSELSIPKNPYTPVGKAEAVAQPALSVTSEIAKFSIINEQAKLASQKQQEDAVVFAESAPKHKTSIQQIGESVFDKEAPKPEKDSIAPRSFDLPTRQETQKPQKTESQFEKRFGKVRPAGASATASNADSAEVKPVGELNIAPMITARDLKPENDPSKLAQPDPEEKDPNIALLDEQMPPSEMKLKIENIKMPEPEPEPEPQPQPQPEPQPEKPEQPEVTEPEPAVQEEEEDKNDSLEDFFAGEEGTDHSVELSDSAVVLTGLEPEQPEAPAEVKPEPEQPEASAEVKPEPEQPEAPAEEKPEPEQPEASAEEKPEPEQPEAPAEVKPEPEQPEAPAEEKPQPEQPEAPAEEKPEPEQPEAPAEEKPEPEQPEAPEKDIVSAPEETEELTEHIEPDRKNDFLKDPDPDKKPAQKKQPEPEPEKEEPAAEKSGEENAEEASRPSLFEKFRNKIFDAGETDSIYETGQTEPEKNKSSTNSFIDKIRNKLKNRVPEAEEEDAGESREMEEFFSDVTEPEKTAPEASAEKPEDSGTELFRSRKNEPMEIGIEKGADGNIVISSVSGHDGKPTAVEIKDGNAELKAAAEQEKKEASVSAPSQDEKAEKKEPPQKKEGRRKKKKKKNKNAAANNAAVSAGIADAAGAAGAVGAAADTAAKAAGATAAVNAAAAVGTAAAAGAGAAAAIGAAAAVVKGAEKLSGKDSSPAAAETAQPPEKAAAEPVITAEPEITETTAEVILDSEKTDIPYEFIPEPESPEPLPEVKPEPEKVEAPVEVKPEPENAETPVEVKPDPEKVETPVEVKPEPENAETPVEVKPEPENAETPVEVKPEPENAEAPVEVKPEPEKVEAPVEVKPEPEKVEAPVEVKPEPEKVEAPVEVKPEPEAGGTAIYIRA